MHESARVTYLYTITIILYRIKRFIGTNDRKWVALYRLKRFRGTNFFSERKIIFVELKFRKCETPLLEAAWALVSPFPEGRDLG